jgi:hypothetical protein
MFKKYRYITVLFFIFNNNLYCPSKGGHSAPAPAAAPTAAAPTAAAPTAPTNTTFTVTAVTWGGMDGKSVMLNGSVLQYNGMSIRGDGSVVGLGVTTYNNQNNILAIAGNVIQVNNQVFQIPIFPAPQLEAPVDYSKMNATTFSAQVVPTGKDNRIKYATRAGELNKNLLISANNVISAINYNAPEDMIKDQLNQLKDAISKGSSYSIPIDKLVDTVSRLFDYIYPQLKLTNPVAADQLKKDMSKLKKNPTKEGLLKFAVDLQKTSPSLALRFNPSANIVSGKGTDDDYQKVANKIVDSGNGMSLRPGILYLSSTERKTLEALAKNPNNIVIMRGFSSGNVSQRTKDIQALQDNIDKNLTLNPNNKSLYIVKVDCSNEKDVEIINNYLKGGLKGSSWYPSYGLFIYDGTTFVISGSDSKIQGQKDGLYDIGSSFDSKNGLYKGVNQTTSDKETNVIIDRLQKLSNNIKV